MTRHTLEPIHMDKPAQTIINVDRNVLKTFVRDVLSYDGVLALRIIATNAGGTFRGASENSLKHTSQV